MVRVMRLFDSHNPRVVDMDQNLRQSHTTNKRNGQCDGPGCIVKLSRASRACVTMAHAFGLEHVILSPRLGSSLKSSEQGNGSLV